VITGIVLAAGSSSRLGRPKQLLDLGGKPVLQHVVDAALAAPLDEVVVVLGHAAREIGAAVPPTGRTRFALNTEYGAGQATSLRTGLRAADAGSQAAVVLLGDQPGVRAEAIAAVVAAWERGAARVVQASYGGHPAHPTLFDRSVWGEVEQTAGDQGARSLLASHPEWTVLVEVGGEPPEDIDTEEDYLRVRATFQPY
jgi:molybdenum cofactor cytidylyltransferase